MMPVEEGKTSSGLQWKISAAAAQVARAAARPGFAGGAVGVAGVDGCDADMAASGAEMGLVNDERGGGDAVGGEDGGGAGRLIGDDEGKVGAAALLEAGFGGAKAEAARNERLGVVGHVGFGHDSRS